MKKLLAMLVLAALVAAACGSSGAPVGTDAAPSTDAAPGSASPDEVPATDPPPTVEPALSDSDVHPVPDNVSFRFGKLTERTLDIGADGQNTTAAVTGMNAFAIDLYSAVTGT